MNKLIIILSFLAIFALANEASLLKNEKPWYIVHFTLDPGFGFDKLGSAADIGFPEQTTVKQILNWIRQKTGLKKDNLYIIRNHIEYRDMTTTIDEIVNANPTRDCEASECFWFSYKLHIAEIPL